MLRYLLLLVVLTPAAWAAEYPTKPIRFINPTAPGGTAEPIARVIALKMAEHLGQTVVVDSRGGAGGTVGTATAANAAPDGYTILLGVVSPMAINVTLYGSKLPYHPLKHFAPVSMITKVPQVLSVHPGVQATSIKQLIELAKAPGNKLNYGSAGSGTTGHLVAELLKKRAGIAVTHIPFKGSGPALRRGHHALGPACGAGHVAGRAPARAGDLGHQPHAGAARGADVHRIGIEYRCDIVVLPGGAGGHAERHRDAPAHGAAGGAEKSAGF